MPFLEPELSALKCPQIPFMDPKFIHSSLPFPLSTINQDLFWELGIHIEISQSLAWGSQSSREGRFINNSHNLCMYFNRGIEKAAEEEGMLILTVGNHGKSQGRFYRESTWAESSRIPERGGMCKGMERHKSMVCIWSCKSPGMLQKLCVLLTTILQDRYYCLSFSSFKNLRPRN